MWGMEINSEAEELIRQDLDYLSHLIPSSVGFPLSRPTGFYFLLKLLQFPPPNSQDFKDTLSSLPSTCNP